MNSRKNPLEKKLVFSPLFLSPNIWMDVTVWWEKKVHSSCGSDHFYHYSIVYQTIEYWLEMLILQHKSPFFSNQTLCMCSDMWSKSDRSGSLDSDKSWGRNTIYMLYLVVVLVTRTPASFHWNEESLLEQERGTPYVNKSTSKWP